MRYRSLHPATTCYRLGYGDKVMDYTLIGDKVVIYRHLHEIAHPGEILINEET
jgi:class 3 adenylate cyclase